MYRLSMPNSLCAGFIACVVSLTTIAGESRGNFQLFDAVQHVVEVLQSAEPSNAEVLVDIPDAVLRRAIEEELAKSEGEAISRGDMTGLSSLVVSGNVRRVEGLEYASNLVDFRCYCSDRATGALISDLAPLAALDGLASLTLFNCGSYDVAPLSRIGSLRHLVLYNNHISDIEPFRSLNALTYLDLQRNVISDLGSLSGLNVLNYVNLKENHISNVRPLVENEGLGAGSRVRLWGNPLSVHTIETDIPLLRERGADVDGFDAPESSGGVEFVDPELRRVVEKQLRKGDDRAISVADMEELFVLDARGFHVEGSRRA